MTKYFFKFYNTYYSYIYITIILEYNILLVILIRWCITVRTAMLFINLIRKNDIW